MACRAEAWRGLAGLDKAGRLFGAALFVWPAKPERGSLHLMKLTIILLAVGVAVSASARSDTDYPHRDWGQVVPLEMSVADAAACVAREMDRKGSVLVLPVDGGTDVDFSAAGMFGASGGEPWERFKIRQSGQSSTLQVFYRHPVNLRWINRDVRKLGKACLKLGPAGFRDTKD